MRYPQNVRFLGTIDHDSLEQFPSFHQLEHGKMFRGNDVDSIVRDMVKDGIEDIHIAQVTNGSEFHNQYVGVSAVSIGNRLRKYTEDELRGYISVHDGETCDNV